MTGKVFLESCTKLSTLYGERFLKPRMAKFPKHTTDIWDSLKFSLDGYAFEHQGRSPDYAPTAVDTIVDFQNCAITKVKATDIWNSFVSRVEGLKENDKDNLNEAINPLCPNGTEYTHKSKVEKATVKKITKNLSVIELLQESDFHNMASLITYVGNALSAGKTTEAHYMLKRINGIGNKIASLFLRDVAVILNIDVRKNKDKQYLLQPVDGWIRFCIFLCQQSLGQKQSEKSDTQRGKFIVENLVEPEKANQGMWYFCAQVANSSRYKVKQSFKDTNYMNELIKEHLEYLKLSGEAADSVKI